AAQASRGPTPRLFLWNGIDIGACRARSARASPPFRVARRQNRPHGGAWCDARGSGGTVLCNSAGATNQIEGKEPCILRVGRNRRGTLPVLRDYSLARRKGVSGNRTPDDSQREEPLPKVEKPMKASRFATTHSIEE